jgi:ribokinase|tara:strand:+ start:47899 stop:48891 length:993 start_codon:yes stop_codon:yes gene_type:complete
MEKLDFVAIGDITTDAFIKLKDAKVHCKVNHNDCELCVRFGDKVPYESVTEVRAVGNSPNAAVSAHRLGLNSALITNLGDDENGEKCINKLKEEGVNCDYISVHENKETNYHYVLWYEAERTILVKHHEYEYKLPELSAPKWLYLSSLGENSLPYHNEIEEYLRKNPETKLAFQPGTFQMKLGYEKLKSLYKETELFFCNKEEAQRILNTDESDIKNLLGGICELGPKISIITDGRDGAYAFDGNEIWHTPMYPDPKAPVDRTGAGDSFASTFTAALALGKTIPEALSWGPINSMSVVQHVGAQEGLLTLDKLEDLLAKAPTDYKLTQIT